MSTLHARAVDSALEQGDTLRRLFATLGDTEHPRGRILSAYRVARRALVGNLLSPLAVQEALTELRRSVRDAMETLLRQAAAGGSAQAASDLALYGLTADAADVGIGDAVNAVLEPLDTQITQVRLLAASGQNDSVILGDDGRVGVLSPAPVVADGARWLVWAALMGWGAVIDGALQDDTNRFVKQAVAGIDERTTDCCLRVHGQTQPVRRPFHLTGTPRFADYMQNPPFHRYCRTATALVLAEDADDNLTREMRAAARAELRARTITRKRVEIAPADARSRRR